jgi:hypothetical protein
VAIRIHEGESTIAPMDEGRAITGGQSFGEYSEMMPEDASSGFAIAADTPSSQSSDVPKNENNEGFNMFGGEDADHSPSTKRLKMSRKMKKAMEKIKEKVATFPILWFKAKEMQHPEWALDEEEKAIITDSLDFVFEILNVEFEIQTLDIKLTSIWWVIAYPVAAIGMIFAIKSNAVKQAHPEELSEEKTK